MQLFAFCAEAPSPCAAERPGHKPSRWVFHSRIRTLAVSVPAHRPPTNPKSSLPRVSLGSHSAKYLFHRSSTVFLRKARMLKIGLQIAGALYCRIDQAGAILAESFKEGAAVSAVFGTCPLIAWIEGPEPAIRPEIRPIPQRHQSEHARLNAPHPGFAVPFEEMQFLEPLEYPVWEIDLDAVWVEDLPVEIVRHSCTYRKLVDFGVPAHSRRIRSGIRGRSAALFCRK